MPIHSWCTSLLLANTKSRFSHGDNHMRYVTKKTMLWTCKTVMCWSAVLLHRLFSTFVFASYIVQSSISLSLQFQASSLPQRPCWTFFYLTCLETLEMFFSNDRDHLWAILSGKIQYDSSVLYTRTHWRPQPDPSLLKPIYMYKYNYLLV